VHRQPGGDPDDLVRLDGSVVKQPADRVSLKQLHDHVVGIAVVAPVEDFDDAGVLQARLELCLGTERLDESRVATFGRKKDLPATARPRSWSVARQTCARPPASRRSRADTALR